MEKKTYSILISLLVVCSYYGQTSWTGATNNKWKTASNWTNGVPNQNTDAIIGDANFTGPNQPQLNGNAKCKNLTIGNGAVASTLSLKKHITIYEDLLIGANGTIDASSNKTLTLKGNWTNNGTYSATHNSAKVTFSGSNHTISGVTTFKLLNINSNAAVTLSDDISIENQLTNQGILDPTIDFSVNGTGNLELKSNGTILVHTANFTENFPISGSLILSNTSTVNYVSSSITQYISNAMSYGRLRISGGSTKELNANLPDLQSNSGGAGRIYIDAGTFDLKTYTADRGTSSNGGDFIMAAGTTLKIGGNNGFPANYDSKSISSTCTVEYYGNDQTVEDVNYGNLIFSITSGSVTKTMPGTSLVINGDFTTSIGTGTDMTFTSGSDIEVKGNITIGTGVIFNGSSDTHTFRGDWINNGTYTGSGSTCYFRGESSNLSGTGTNNFHNLHFRASGITADATTDFLVSGDLKTYNGGRFIHTNGGTVTMTGNSKVISGNGFDLYNLTVSDIITTASDITIRGDFICNGYFTATNGCIDFDGNSKSISGSGGFTFKRININDNISTNRDIIITSNVYVAPSATFTASSGTVTFNGSTTLTGIATLNNITINSSKLLRMGTNSKIQIAGVFSKNGNFNSTSYKPNIIEFNGPGNQDIPPATYYDLILANSGTKSVTGDINVYGDLSINSGVSMDGSSHIITVYMDWNNSGTFIASTSDVRFRSGYISNIYGVNTFNDFTVNKSSALTYAYLKDNATASNIIITKGILDTESNSITTIGGRTGNGFIYGTITHNHIFTHGTAYFFEGPKNSIKFTSPSVDLTSVSVKCVPDEVSDFDPNIECIHREYEITIPSGTYTNATLTLHYLDNELNAFEEPFLAFYKHNTGIVWDSIGFTSRNTSQDWVEHTGLTSITGRYTLSGTRRIVEWDGSESSDWNDQDNWTTVSGTDMSNRVPQSDDAVRIGVNTFTNQPSISSIQEITALKLGSAKGVNLTLNNNLNVLSSLNGIWSTNRSHTIDIGSNTLDIGRNLDLSDGISGDDISISISSGILTIGNDLDQEVSSSISFSSNGTMEVTGNYNYSSGTFTAGTGTVNYSGTEVQTVAPVDYYNLNIDKSNERALFDSPTTVNGNLALSTGGSSVVSDMLTVNGNITIGAFTEFIDNNAQILLSGDWTNNGTFIPGVGTMNFVGNSNQSANQTTFNKLVVDKSTGILNVTGNLQINSDLTLTNGTIDLDTYTLNRTNNGGTFSMASGTNLLVGGSDNFPDKFVTNTLDNSSTVSYDGTAAQNVRSGITYGILEFSNGNANAKSIDGDITVNTELQINSGATIEPDSVNITLYGNLVNNGTITPGESTIILEGTSKTLSGPMNINNLSVNGSYSVIAGTTTMNGDLYVESTGSLSFGNFNAILDGDLTNKGSLTSNGTATFSGTRVQTLRLLNAISSSSTGIINFNGTVAPIINSTSSPSFATVNINNTAGISPSMPWYVYFACNIAAGASFNGGALTHSFFGNFTNNGDVTSSGTLQFSPGPPFSASGTITLDGNSFVSTGDVEFGGSAPLTIVDVAPTFNNVIISNSHSSGVTAPSSWNITNELQILSGSIFNAGTGTSHNISESILNNGTLNGASSTISFNDTGCNIDGVGTTTFCNLTITSGSDLTLNKSISIDEDLTVDGTLNSSGRKLTFSGTTNSQIGGLAGSLSLEELEHYKVDANTTLNIPLTITEELTLTRGNIITDATNILTLTDDAVSSPGKNKGFVDGPMTKVGDDAFIFPLGNNSKWARLGISAPSLTTDAFRAQYFETFYSDTNTMAVSPVPVINNVSKVEYWTCDRTAGSSNVTVQLFWEDNAYSGINDYSDDLVVARWNGSAWENMGQSAINGASSGDVTSDVITSFSPFTFGSKSGSLNPLPIELLYFDATPVQDVVLLEWETASELNNDYFSVEKSKRGELWELVTTVHGAGNSNSNIHYSTRDYNPFEGISYYRLKQTDFDGKFSYSSIQSVEFLDPSESKVWVYPNPSKGQLTLSGAESEISDFKIYNPVGQEVTSQVYILSNFAGGYVIDMKHLSQGIYTIITKTQAVKVFIE